jgi:DNA polymerase-3 subunit gamma/tau
VSRPRGSNPTSPEADPVGYTVVARRYRPQRFEDVVGQDHVVQALRNAIRLNRVTHAYLFSGTRGVGKTSIARIFAKCLNCVQGPTEEPDQTCDICRSISLGQDVDVIEIDGASNNGVEQVRELRQNAGLRPSRARFKIYYIDEVHMLSTGAFNALLKTLEEPPPHVKFFFATTEPNKIPITVLSRCQRYDFAGITPDQITETLAEICAREKVEADPEALGVIARRAGGSMRDAQSLLEQLLSFGGERLTVELVQQQLGIASDERTLDLLDALSRRDAADAIRIVDQTASSGVQPTELLSGALEFLRDAMMIAVKADVLPLAASPRQKPRLREIAERWSLDTLLAALQILAEARGRLRGSPHGRTLVEIAILRVALLDNLGELGEVVARLVALEGGAPPVSSPEKKKLRPPEAESTPIAEAKSAASSVAELVASQPSQPPEPAWDLSTVLGGWTSWVGSLAPEISSRVAYLRPIALTEPDILVIEPLPGYNWVIDAFERSDFPAKIESSLRNWFDRHLVVRFQRQVEARASSPGRHPSSVSRSDGLEDDPLVKLIVEQFEARAVRVEVEEESEAAET